LKRRHARRTVNVPLSSHALCVTGKLATKVADLSCLALINGDSC
jgi:hypothetical protein